jgi:tRNA (cmo5U34)-methyltransferase
VTASKFDFDQNPDFVSEYDRGPPLFIPGYAASHAMAAAVLLDRIGPQGDVLIVGAGGGVEIAAFHRFCEGWQYTGVDPSQAMLDLASARLSRDAPGIAVALVSGVATDAPVGPFDAATAFHCLMFAPDDGTRLAELQAIHARLKPCAPFLLCQPATDKQDWMQSLGRYAHHARLMGAEEDLITRASAMVESQVHILSPARDHALLKEAGFTVNGEFYRGLWVRGWEATA